MTLLSTSPFESLLTLQRDLQRALDAPMFGLESARSVFPPLNVFHDRDGIVIRAEVPGFKPEQIELAVEPHTLVIKGEHPADAHERARAYHRRERQHGSFSRSLALPKGLDTAQASAECRNGLLTIRIPKAEAAKPRQIPVRSAA